MTNQDIRFLLCDFANRSKGSETAEVWRQVNRSVLLDIVSMIGHGSPRSFNEGKPVWWRCMAAMELMEYMEACSNLSMDDDETVALILGVLGRHQVFGVYSGEIRRLPRLVSLRGLLSTPGRMSRYLFEAGLGAPVMQVHLPKLTHRRFDGSANSQAHQWIARALSESEGISAVFNGGSWFLDPNLAEISPHLRHLSEFASGHGAMLIPLGTNANAIDDATFKSARRRQLFEQGRYTPRRFARVWPRKGVLDWFSGIPATEYPWAKHERSVAAMSVH